MNKLLCAAAGLSMLCVSTAGQAQKDPQPDAINYNASKSNTGNRTIGPSTGQPGKETHGDKNAHTAAIDHPTGQAVGKRRHKPVRAHRDKGAPAAADHQSGMSSGRRQHTPIIIHKEIDKASP